MFFTREQLETAKICLQLAILIVAFCYLLQGRSDRIAAEKDRLAILDFCSKQIETGNLGCLSDTIKCDEDGCNFTRE